MDYYIKSTDEQSLWEAMESAGLAYKDYDREDPLNTPSGELDWVPTGAFTWISKAQLDVIGTIYIDTGRTEEIDGKEIISSTGNSRISNMINSHYWFRLTYGRNILSINSPCIIQIICNYPVYI